MSYISTGQEKGTIRRDYGSISTLLNDSNPSYVAVEISGKGTKKISSIMAQYAHASSADVTVIKSGRLLVVRGDIANFNIPINPDNFGVDDFPDVVFDVNIVDFEAKFFSFIGQNLESGADQTLSVLLFFPASSTGDDVIGRLTVLGASTSNQLKGVSLNAN